MGAGCSAPGAGCAGGDLRCCRRGRVPAASPGMEGQAGVLSPAGGAGCRGLPWTERVRGSQAWPQLGERFCAQGTLALPLVLPAGRPRDGESGCRPLAGLPVRPLGGRRAPGTGKAAPVGAQHGGPQPVPTGHVPPVARGCLWVQEGAWGSRGSRPRSPPRAGAARLGGQERALSGSGPDAAGTGAVPAPAPGVAGCWSVPPLLLLLLLCVGGFQPDPGSRPLSRGERGRCWGPVPVSPCSPLPSRVHGTGEPLPKAPGRAARAREAAGFAGAAAARGLCGRSLTVPRLSLCRDGRTDGRRSPATPGAAEPPGRSRAACAEADAAACPARGPAPGWGQPCLARPVPPRLQLSCLGPRLFWVPFQLPVPSVWLCGLLSVAGPACGRLQFSLQAQLSSGSCSRVSALVSGPARGRLQFISMPACGWFQLGCGSGSAAAPAPRRFQFLSAPAPFGSSSGLLKRSWLLARS